MSSVSVSPSTRAMDAYEFASRYSNDNRIKYDEIRELKITYEEMRPFIEQLPERERDLLSLYYRGEKNQKDIAMMFGVTQGAISSRLNRAKSRLRFLRDMPKITSDELEKSLTPYFDSIEVAIIVGMMRTTCQSKTAVIVNEQFNLRDEKKRMTQVKVRHRFEKCLGQLATLKKKNPNMAKYHNLLDYIKDNLYMLHEVKLPHFDRGKFAVCALLS